jgi:diguanylate cyclase (GGDEF)-like protein/PAS domain S-box-containing protein
MKEKSHKKPHPGRELFPGQRKASFAAWVVLGISLFATITTWWYSRSHFVAHLHDRLPTYAGTNPPLTSDYSLQFLLGGLVLSALLFAIALMVDSRRAESEAWIRAFVNHAPDGIIIFDAAGAIDTFNPGAERIFGYPAAAVRGRNINDLLPSWWPTNGKQIASFLATLDGDVMGGGEEVEGLRKDKATVPIELTVSRMTSAKHPMFTAIIRDISHRKETEEALRRSEERYALAAWASNEGLWDWDLLTEQVYYSPRWKSMLGFEESEMAGRPSEWIHRLHPDDHVHFEKTLRAHLEGDTPHFEVEYRIRHRDSTYRWMLCKGVAVQDENQQPLRIVGLQTDITSRKKVELQLMRDALFDSITGLPNRSHFLRVVQHVVEDNRNTPNEFFAVLYLDLDRFKHVNDSLGHHIGDQLLAGIADRFKKVLRPQETLARLGGDEFAILVEGLQEPNQAAHTAERLQKELASPFLLDGNEVCASVSIGIAVNPEREETPEGLLRDADTAMYRAKAAGKGRHAFFDQIDVHSGGHSGTAIQSPDSGANPEANRRQANRRQANRRQRV